MKIDAFLIMFIVKIKVFHLTCNRWKIGDIICSENNAINFEIVQNTCTMLLRMNLKRIFDLD